MKFGFVYIWYDRKHKRYYIGSHWGEKDDGYICSSTWMKNSYQRRPNDFHRRILFEGILTKNHLLDEENKWLGLIKDEEIGIRYYNLTRQVRKPWWSNEEKSLTVGQKISKTVKGRKKTAEHIEKIASQKRGKKQSEETKRKRSESLKGHVGHMRGKIHSEETKRKIAESVRRARAK